MADRLVVMRVDVVVVEVRRQIAAVESGESRAVLARRTVPARMTQATQKKLVLMQTAA